MIDWLDFLAAQPGFKRVGLGDADAVEVPIYEAIYLAQCVGTGGDTSVYIEPEDGDPIQFPKATPTVRIADIHPSLTASDPRSSDGKIAPLLSPSMAYVREQVPDFFTRDVKYITTERYDTADLGGVDQIHRVCLSASAVDTDLSEGLTEYLVSHYLRRQGYIVDSFGGGLPGRGGPDLYAIALPKLQDILAALNIVSGGFYLVELELHNVETQHTQLPAEQKTCVIEVESAYDSSRFYDGKDEAKEYARDGWFNEAYGAMGFVEGLVKDWQDRIDVGFITFNSQGEYTEISCPREYGTPEKVDKTREQVRNVVKQVLIKNARMQDVMESVEASSFYDVTQEIDNMSITDAAEIIR